MPPQKKTLFTWQDGHTHLSFGLFALVVFALLALRIANPDNWIVLADTSVECGPACGHDQVAPRKGDRPR
jgi:hypothetical protein